jgi:hypothetical protein
MKNVLEVLMKLMQVLPLVMQSVELFTGSGQGAVKKDVVKKVIKGTVVNDPEYDDLIDVAIETVHRKTKGLQDSPGAVIENDLRAGDPADGH